MDYKDKLRLAKEALESGSYDKETIEYIFPELKESEDEKIRKELAQYLKDYPNLSKGNYCRDDFFAWLEKQGEQKLLNNDKYQTVSVKILDRLYESEKELEQLKQGEKIDKLVKYREWLISETERWHEKENDKTNSNAGKHCCIGAANAFISARAEFEEIFDYESWPEKQGEQKPMEYLKFKVGDSIEYNDKQWGVIGIDIENHCYDLTDDECVDFDTAHYSFKLVEQKPAWSEEDEKIKYEIEVILANTDLSKLKLNYTFFNMISWLKSLKDRYTWKPSEEQITALEASYSVLKIHDTWCEDEHLPVLMSLINDLKKL